MCFALMFCVVSATYVPPPHSTTKPGFPVPMNTDNPGVRKAARFGVYRYNNSSNDLFLFKESQINKAMVQVRRAQTSGGPPNHLPIDPPTEHPRHGSPDLPQGCYACLKINSTSLYPIQLLHMRSPPHHHPSNAT